MPTEKSSAVATGETAPLRVEESEPSLYYLKDKQGNLQAVPNFTYEDFVELYKLKHQLVQGDQRPRYSLREMTATGTVNAVGQAELSIQFRIVVNEDQWTRIPLRLDHAVLRETAKYLGSGEHFLDFEGDGEGYVAWIRGAAGQQHQLTLKVLVPLTVLGQETRLRLLAPRVTASKLKLTVPIAKASARSVLSSIADERLAKPALFKIEKGEGALLQTPGGGDNETELTVDGLNGDFELSWRSADASPGKTATLEAYGNIAAHLDARGVESEANFTVRSYGEAFDRFRIRLPPDTMLVPGNPSGYTLTAVDAGPASSGPGSQRVVEVRLAKRTVGPVEVHLSTQRAADDAPAAPGSSVSRGEKWQELAGFAVLSQGTTGPEAARQWGTIAVSVASDWQVLWGTSRGIRQIDQLPEVLRRKDVTAAEFSCQGYWEYFAQPSSLMARLVPKKTRIGVEPEYVVLVDSDQVRLEARLRYTVHGAKVSAVDIAMPDWQIDEVGPDSVVAIDGVRTGPGSSLPGSAGPLLSLPLMMPTIGQFEVRLKAHRPLSPAAKSLSLVLPQPQASAPAAAVVAVLPADNVEILPAEPSANGKGQAITGLLRQQTAVPLAALADWQNWPLRQQEPLFYRSDAPKAVFAAELRRHQQKITAGVTSGVNLPLSISSGNGGGGQVDQKFAWSISYEPTDYVMLEIPRELSAKGRLVLTCDQQVLTPVPISEEPVSAYSLPGPGLPPSFPVGGTGEEGEKPQRMRVALPKSYIGLCEVAARYSLLPPAAAADGDFHVPLIMPLDAELTSNIVTVTPPAEQQVEVASGPFSPLHVLGTAVEGGLSSARSDPWGGELLRAAASSSRTQVLAAAERTAEIVFKLRGESGGDAAVVVDRAWIQTCVTRQTAAARQDQVVLRLSTRRREIEIALPEGAARDQATVQLARVVAGQTGVAVPVTPGVRGERVLIIPLLAQPRDSDRLLPAEAGPAGGSSSPSAPPSFPVGGAGCDIEPQSYVLSLQYHFPGQRASRGAMKFEFASLGDDAWIRHAYWQLFLPPEEHLVESPQDLTGEFAWGWNRFYFGRRPVLSQTDLDAWAGLRPTDSTPEPAGMNEYLFSTLGRLESCEIVTAGRSTIIFVSSGIALLAGLLLIYVRAARHPAVLLAAAAVLAGLAAIYPELALLAAQASAIGLALVLVALFLRQLTAGRPDPRREDTGPLLAEVPSAVTPLVPLARPSEAPVPIPTALASSKVTILPMPPPDLRQSESGAT